MKKKNILITVYLFVSVLSLSCSSTPRQSKDALKVMADRTTKEMFNRAFEVVPTIDDGISDAQTISLALASACSAEYSRNAKAFADLHLSDDHQKRIFINRCNTNEAKINTFLRVVLKYRTSLKNK